MSKRKTAGLIQRGEIWHYDKQIRGRRLTGSTGTSDYREAERYLARILEQDRQVHVYGERPAVTVREACEKFIRDYCPEGSLERRARALDTFLPHVGELDLTLLHDGSLNGWRAERRKVAGAGTMNLELSILARVMNLAARVWRHDNGRPFVDTAPLFQREKGGARKPYPLSREEQRRLCSALTERMATVVEFLANTGLRSGELRALRWDWRVRVPELNAEVFIIPEHATKTNTERVVVLNRTAARIVREREAAGESPDYVFVNEQGKPWASSWSSWRRACKEAGIPARIHDLRHTYGQRLRAAGVDVETRADLLGHAAGRMTTHYSAPELSKLIEAANSIIEARPATVLRAVS